MFSCLKNPSPRKKLHATSTLFPHSRKFAPFAGSFPSPTFVYFVVHPPAALPFSDPPSVYSVFSVGTISSSSSSSEPVSPADRAPVPVVCAVLEDTAGRILIAQRPAHKHLGLLWEFPGGKVDPGETPAAALHRELTEELGCTVTITRTLEPFLHDYTRVIIEMFPFVCHLAPGSPAPAALEHLALRWVTPRELSSFDLAPADWPVVARYRAHPDPCCAP